MTARNELNTYLQSIGQQQSLSWDDQPSGPNHEVVWTSTCKLDGVAVGTGSSSKKRLAREAAAENAFASLKRSKGADSAAP